MKKCGNIKRGIDWLPVGNPQKGGLPLKKKRRSSSDICIVDNYKVDIILAAFNSSLNSN